MIKCPALGKTKFTKFPPYQAAKDVKCPGYAQEGGEGGCLSFDLTGTLDRVKSIKSLLGVKGLREIPKRHAAHVLLG